MNDTRSKLICVGLQQQPHLLSGFQGDSDSGSVIKRMEQESLSVEGPDHVSAWRVAQQRYAVGKYLKCVELVEGIFEQPKKQTISEENREIR